MHLQQEQQNEPKRPYISSNTIDYVPQPGNQKRRVRKIHTKHQPEFYTTDLVKSINKAGIKNNNSSNY